MATDDVLRADILEAALRGRFGHPLKLLHTTTSTNSVALEWAERGAPEGALVVADHQTAGRGRWGRSWISEPGRALLWSLVLRPPLDADHTGLITTVAGVACAEALEQGTGLPTRVKWPNDVTVEGRKLAGILVETRVRASHIEVVVAGVGMNFYPLALPEKIAAGAGNIADEMARAGRGLPPARAEVLAATVDRFEELYGMLEEGAGGDLIERASERSDLLGRTVTVRLPDERLIEGRAERLLPSGALELEVKGKRLVISSGEVVMLRAGGQSVQGEVSQ